MSYYTKLIINQVFFLIVEWNDNFGTRASKGPTEPAPDDIWVWSISVIINGRQKPTLSETAGPTDTLYHIYQMDYP